MTPLTRGEVCERMTRLKLIADDLLCTDPAMQDPALLTAAVEAAARALAAARGEPYEEAA